MFVHNHSGNKKPTTHFCAIKSSLYFTYLYIHLILYFLQYKISLNNNYNWKSSICYTQVFYFWFWRTGGGVAPHSAKWRRTQNCKNLLSTIIRKCRIFHFWEYTQNNLSTEMKSLYNIRRYQMCIRNLDSWSADMLNFLMSYESKSVSRLGTI